MKFIYGLLLAVGCASITLGEGTGGELKCTLKHPNIPADWLDMESNCTQSMRKQVQTEIDASITYLAMGAYFARDTVNRPGFSKLFFESASEEREHALKIIEYLLMRGYLTNDISKLLNFPLRPKQQVWANGESALSDALTLEAQVTRSIRQIILTCETPVADGTNDYHLADWLAADFLDEQYKGQRNLAGKLSTLGKMMFTHGALAEYLFDKKLLNGEI